MSSIFAQNIWGGSFGDFPSNAAYSIWLNDPNGYYGDPPYASPPSVQSALDELGASHAVVNSTYALLDGTNQPFTGDIWLLESDLSASNVIVTNTASASVVDTVYIENSLNGALTVKDNLIVDGTIIATGLYDADGDTSVRVESTLDRDMIDFYEGGEHLMEADGGSVFFNPNRGDLDFIVGHRGTLYNTIWYNAGTQNLSFNGNTIFNQQRQDVDFTIRKETAGDAYNYDAGTDIHTFGSDVFVSGVVTADGLTLDEDELISWAISGGLPDRTFYWDSTTHDFHFSDDINVYDVDPHYALIPEVGDAFEFYAFGDELYCTNLTTGEIIWRRRPDGSIDFDDNNIITSGTFDVDTAYINSIYADADTSGILTLGGTGGANNENLTFDFETASNRVILGTTTGQTFIDFNTLDLSMRDDEIIVYGSGFDWHFLWETEGNDYGAIATQVGSGGRSGYISILEVPDIGNANRSPLATSANPVLRGYSSDEDEALDYWELTHNQDDVEFNAGAGDIKMTVAGGEVIITDGGKLQVNSAGDDKYGQFWHDDVGAFIAVSSGGLRFDSRHRYDFVDDSGLVAMEFDLDTAKDQLTISTRDTIGNQFIFINDGNTNKDHHFPVAADPTVVIQSDDDVNVSDNRRGWFVHDGDDFHIRTGALTGVGTVPATVTNDVRFFDGEDIHNDSPGKALWVVRNAAEADDWIKIWIGADTDQFIECSNNVLNLVDDNLTTLGGVFVGASQIGDTGITHFTQIEADGTIEFNGDATVWDDLVMPFTLARVPAANAPNWEAFIGNLNAYTFADGDFLEGTTEILHSWKEGSTISWHVHWGTNGLEGVNKAVEWEIEYTFADMDADSPFVGGAFGATTTDSVETVIPANTADLTHMYTTIETTALTTEHIGAQVLWRIRRITAVGNAPVADPFGFAVGIHFEEDTGGSRTIVAK